MDSAREQEKKGAVAIKPVLIEEELKGSFLDYAMSVVVSRAIPDVRDGLKPVHRRVLYTMHTLGFHHTKPHRKSVRVVGEVLGKFHPHGDQAVYNTMVGMVQDFSKRYPLLDGQGNWGSVDGDNAAAMRYTEVRMAKISQELLADIEKETVLFVPNFDDTTTEPVVLPSRLPHLLINGTSGIAVGMATAIPPHNLTEVLDACLAVLDNPALSDEKLFALVPGPDFPTGGIICGRGGVIKAYKTGRGNVLVRGVVEVEEDNKKTSLVITELPYQVNKADLAMKIANLVRDKVIDGISNIKDESNKKGMRLVIDLKRGEIPQVVLNQLYKHTPLQTSISFLMLALLDNRPMIFTLRHMLDEFLYHRKQVVYRRSVYDLDKAVAREHLLEGFIIGLQNIDEVVSLIKKAKHTEEAIEVLYEKFKLSDKQGKAILEMRLQRLTGLEQDKIYAEMDEIKKHIKYLTAIIQDQEVLKQEVIKELEELRATYGDTRRTRIEGAIDILTEADLIPDEDVVVTLTMKGYTKRVPLNVYGVQHRGGKGKMGMATLEGSDDYIQDVFVAKNHDVLLFFTNLGRVYSLTVFEIPEATRTAKGRAIVNLLPLQPGEQVVKLLCTREMENKFVIMLSKNGIIKRTEASAFEKIRSTGIRAITLREDEKDELVFCAISDGSCSVIIATSNGQGIRFKEDEVRSMGRQASGVIGIRLKKDDYVVGMEVVCNEATDILFGTERGYGKKVHVTDFRLAHRGGVGVRTIPTQGRNGKVVGLAIVSSGSDILLVDDAGKIIRLPANEVRSMGRQAKGVRLIRLDQGQTLSNIFSFVEAQEGDSANVSNDVGNPPQGGANSARSSKPKLKADGTLDESESYQMAELDDVELIAEHAEEQDVEEVRVQSEQTEKAVDEKTEFDSMDEHAEAEKQESLFGMKDDASEDDPFTQF